MQLISQRETLPQKKIWQQGKAHLGLGIVGVILTNRMHDLT